MTDTYDVPILLILYNRPKYISETIKFLNRLKPKKLYVHIDGPLNEIDKNKIIEIEKKLKKINSETEIVYKKNKKNLGCGLGPVTAMNWFFEMEEYGIIIEDDLVPTDTFFQYCKTLLFKYRDDKNIFMISGDNGGPIVPSKLFEKNEIMSVNIPIIWGWATWNDRWENYSYKVDEIKIYETFKKLNGFYFFERLLIINYFLKIKREEILHFWDIQLFYTLISNNKKCLIPSTNLVKNIGFDEDATHTKEVTSRAFANTIEKNFTNFEYTNVQKPTSSKMIYALLTHMNGDEVHGRNIYFLRYKYLSGRFKYFFKALKSKAKKIILLNN